MESPSQEKRGTQVITIEPNETVLTAFPYRPHISLLDILKGEPKLLGAIQILFALVIMSLGIIFAFNVITFSKKFPFVFLTGYPFWGASIFFLTGLVTVTNGKLNKIRGLSVTIMNVISSVVAVAGIVFTIISFTQQHKFCQMPSLEGLCVFGKTILVGALSILLILSIAEFGIAVTIASFRSKCWTHSNKVVFFLPSDVTQNGEQPAQEENAQIQFELQEGSHTDDTSNIQAIFFGGYTFLKLRVSKNIFPFQERSEPSDEDRKSSRALFVLDEQQEGIRLPSKSPQDEVELEPSFEARSSDDTTRSQKGSVSEKLTNEYNLVEPSEMQDYLQDLDSPPQASPTPSTQGLVYSLPGDLPSEIPPSQSPSAQVLQSEPASSHLTQSKDLIPEDLPSQEEPPQEESPQKEPPQEEPPQEEPPEDKPPEDKPPQETPSQDEPSQEGPSQDESPQDEAPEDEPSQDEAPEDESPEDEPPQNEAPEDEPPQDEPPQDEPPQDEPPQDEPPQNEPPQDEPSEEIPSQEEPLQDIAPQDESSEDEDIPSQHSSSQESLDQETPIQDDPQDTPYQDPSSHDIPLMLDLDLESEDESFSEIIYQDIRTEVMVLSQEWKSEKKAHGIKSPRRLSFDIPRKDSKFQKRYSLDLPRKSLQYQKRFSLDLPRRSESSPRRKSLDQKLKSWMFPRKLSMDKQTQYNQTLDQPSDQQAEDQVKTQQADIEKAEGQPGVKEQVPDKPPKDEDQKGIKEQPPKKEIQDQQSKDPKSQEDKSPKGQFQNQRQQIPVEKPPKQFCQDWSFGSFDYEAQDKQSPPWTSSNLQAYGQQTQDWRSQGWRNKDWKAQEWQFGKQDSLNWESQDLLEQESLRQRALYQQISTKNTTSRQSPGWQSRKVLSQVSECQEGTESDAVKQDMCAPNTHTRPSKPEDKKFVGQNPGELEDMRSDYQPSCSQSLVHSTYGTCLTNMESEQEMQKNSPTCSNSNKDINVTSSLCYARDQQQSEESD
ncbi:membrane-spanning 4-domains subfamily A member 14 [Perognathus longimembris pacificus]|uniref:membrane-spanning 4-domains subfamily A member 14 n=1 Tax=Perognathus longimembris pacificus TaxID=214514 RepID=UPI00201890D5|nr:membrane-spanning 4-domains subfamily A member 14 [Perognathus longimembris pacificus]